jgi:hypothetical protein
VRAIACRRRAPASRPHAPATPDAPGWLTRITRVPCYVTGM